MTRSSDVKLVGVRLSITRFHTDGILVLSPPFNVAMTTKSFALYSAFLNRKKKRRCVYKENKKKRECMYTHETRERRFKCGDVTARSLLFRVDGKLMRTPSKTPTALLYTSTTTSNYIAKSLFFFFFFLDSSLRSIFSLAARLDLYYISIQIAARGFRKR